MKKPLRVMNKQEAKSQMKNPSEVMEDVMKQPLVVMSTQQDQNQMER